MKMGNQGGKMNGGGGGVAGTRHIGMNQMGQVHDGLFNSDKSTSRSNWTAGKALRNILFWVKNRH